MFPLDMHTLFFSFVTTTLLCAISMGVLWWQNRSHNPAVLYWFISYVSSFIGLLFILVRNQIPLVLSVFVANLGIIVGLFFGYFGLVKYAAAKTRTWIHLLFIALLMASVMWFTLADESLAARNILVSIGIIYFGGNMAGLAFRRVDNSWQYYAKGVGVTAALLTIFGIARVIANIWLPSGPNIFESSTADVLIMTSNQLILLALNFSLILMISGRLYNELKTDMKYITDVEQALRKSEQKFSIAFRNLPDAIMITTIAEGLIIEANEGFYALTQYSEVETKNATTLELSFWENPEDRRRYCGQLIREGRVTNYEANFHRKNGEVFPAVVSGERVDIEERECALTIIRDITEHKIAEQVLMDLSQRDSLTHLLNRRAFFEAIEERIALVGDETASLIYLDLDGLKTINDTHGHQAGDNALILFSQVLTTVFRDSDAVGRLGGDEFAVFAVYRSKDAAEIIQERLLEQVDRVNSGSGLPYKIGASLGIATWSRNDGNFDIEELIRIADGRMYDAKRRLRKTVDYSE